MPYEGNSGNIEEGMEEGREGGRKGGRKEERRKFSENCSFTDKCVLCSVLALFPGACEQGYFVPWWTTPPFY